MSSSDAREGGYEGDVDGMSDEKETLAKTPEEKAALTAAIKKAKRALMMGRKPVGFKRVKKGRRR